MWNQMVYHSCDCVSPLSRRIGVLVNLSVICGF